ncbi:MAG: SDR family oxidoreductase [Planctomycetota bacterium]
MTNADDYREMTAVVTGAGSGIGQSIAATLAEAGMTVGGLDRDTASVPDTCSPLAADVRDSAAVAVAIDGFAEQHGKLDVLVGNAGVSCVDTIETASEDNWQRVFDINVFGQMRVIRAALPWLRKSRSASIVLVGSCSAISGIPERATYSASKGAVHALARALAVDLVDDGIRVNCASPGTVETPFVEALIANADDPEATRKSMQQRQPTGRMVQPSEVARAVLHLAHPGDRSTTGTTIVIDGGLGTLRPAT